MFLFVLFDIGVVFSVFCFVLLLINKYDLKSLSVSVFREIILSREFTTAKLWVKTTGDLITHYLLLPHFPSPLISEENLH